MIPKKLHCMWLPEYEQAPADRKANPVKWQELNQDHELKIWSYSELRELIGDLYGDFLAIWESLDKPIKQADLARLFVIHAVGGCYFDMDLIPIRSLAEFYSDGCVYNALLRGKKIPDAPSRDNIDMSKYSAILSKEHRPIDRIGVGVANGIIIAEPGLDWLMEFIEAQKFAYRGLVLDYVGTWALTRFVRSRISQLRGRPDDNLLLLPPHYMLWEPHYFDAPPLDYTVCIHPAENSWGDHTKDDWWRT